MKEQNLILDIGIGRGGWYLTDRKDIIRVGYDVEKEDIIMCRNTFGIDNLHLIIGDAFVAGEGKSIQFLPFKDATFREIHTYFPYALFIALTDSSCTLWHEFSRILKDDGSIKILYDTVWGQKRIQTKEKTVIIRRPLRRLREAGSNAGFKFSHTTIFPLDADVFLRSEFSEKVLSNSIRRPGAVEVYRVTAQKTRN